MTGQMRRDAETARAVVLIVIFGVVMTFAYSAAMARSGIAEMACALVAGAALLAFAVAIRWQHRHPVGGDRP